MTCGETATERGGLVVLTEVLQALLIEFGLPWLLAPGVPQADVDDTLELKFGKLPFVS
jgi:hypothetical protein